MKKQKKKMEIFSLDFMSQYAYWMPKEKAINTQGYCGL